MDNIKTIDKTPAFSMEPPYSPQDMFFLQNVVDEIYRMTPIIRFKALFAQASKVQDGEDNLNEVLQQEIQQAFRRTISHVNTMLYHTNRFTPQQINLVGQWIHQEFIAFCLLGTWPSRSFNKPQNIAGDHHTIKQIYQNGNQEKRKMGSLVNYCFFEEPACKAVKNRKYYMQNKILEKINDSDNETVFITSIASGPAEEIFDVYTILGRASSSRLKAIGVDIDKRACAAVDDGIAVKRLRHYFSTCSHDILKLSPPPRYLTGQDIVYSMGLLDYFKDRAAIKIINILYAMLKPGGKIIIGNFHVSCSSRVFLDYLLDWQLIYRTEEDMHRLFDQSAFSGCQVVVDFEPEGVNMLVQCTKE